MSTETKFLGIILITTVFLLFGGVFLLTRKGSSQAVEGTSVVQIDYSKGQRIGSDSARIKMVEFSDFQCSACAIAEPYVKKLRATYPDQVQFIYRHFPLPQHANSIEASTLAEAAGEQDKFWEMHDKLFETQTEWSDLPDATAFFLKLARDLNLDENKIKKALAENIFKSKLDDDMAEGQSLRVNSTPTFFLNGRKLHLQTFDDLNAAVTEELKR